MKPRNIPLSQLSSEFTEPIDLFLCSASFENRCLAAALNLPRDLIRKAVIAYNEHREVYVGACVKRLEQLFPSSHVTLKLNRENPVHSADNLAELFSAVFVGNSKRVLIEVTTFTHEALSILMRVLRAYSRNDDVLTFLYVGAREYSIGDSADEKWLSKGIREIRSILGYPGEVLPSRKMHFVVLAGFEPERTRALVDSFEPSELSIGYGSKEGSTSTKNFQANEHFHEVICQLYPRCQHFMFASNGIEETHKALIEQVEKFPDHNVVMAPMNTKISTIAASIVAMGNERIQLCYAQAELYNYANYSEAGDSCYIFQL